MDKENGGPSPAPLTLEQRRENLRQTLQHAVQQQQALAADIFRIEGALQLVEALIKEQGDEATVQPPIN